MVLARRLLLLGCLAALLLPGPAEAGRIVDREDLQIDLGGDIKAFLNVSFPYEHTLMPEGPQPTGALDFRVRFSGRHRSWLSWELHHAATASFFGAAAAQGALGGGLQAEAAGEGLPLSWTAVDSEGFRLDGRFDRASVAFHVPHLDIRFGRQPISFGSGYFFTPLDLLSPYGPQVVDREYKPGLDAVRFDAFVGQSGRLTAVLGVVDSLDVDGFVLVGSGGFTVGLFDLDFFVGKIYRDLVLGVSAQGSAGALGIHGDVALTVPVDEDGGQAEPTFLRIVVGADARTNSGLTVMAELYAQTLGTSESDDYLRIALTERFTRGDLWTMGRLYGALTVAQEILPILSVSVVTVVNVLDPSAFIGPSLSWSVAGNADFVVGGFFALGARPEELELADFIGPDGLPLPADAVLGGLETGSEFGLMPHQAYAQLKFYF